jgi:hypothetical protein
MSSGVGFDGDLLVACAGAVFSAAAGVRAGGLLNR